MRPARCDSLLAAAPDLAIAAGLMGLDIGPQTRALYAERIATAATLVWDSSDQGTDSIGDWGSSSSLGAQIVGPVLGQITGLVADTQYSWRRYGTNATAEAWSDEVVFASAFSAAQNPVFTNAQPDEDSIRPHSQCVAHQVPSGYFAFALYV